MNLLNSLGIDAADFIWQDLAICDGMDTNLFFDTYEVNKKVAVLTDECCLSCPVFNECQKLGSEGQYGVFGAIYWNGAGNPDPDRNKHKTPEVWSKIKARMTE